MNSPVSPLAGTLAAPSQLIDVDALVAAYYALHPDPAEAAQRVAFGTSGHRGCAMEASFNEWHILAITQAICTLRHAQGITGPLYMGIDTHALSRPACATAVEVLAANGVDVMLAVDDEYTPTPAVSRAILCHNRGVGTAAGRADGIVVTPSHNPPRYGGFKYNGSNGGPAGQEITDAIQAAANGLLQRGLAGVRRLPYAQALLAATTHRYDYLRRYVEHLDDVIDMAAIKASSLRLGVDPMGGAGVHYWRAIAEHWKLDLDVVSEGVDPRFAFMTLDWDGQIRMDPSSPYAMQRLIALKDRYDIAFACDTDHDRHGIVTPGGGLLAPNHYLSVAIDYLLRERQRWGSSAAVGKTVVTTQMIDHITRHSGRALYEVPVGFKWFSAGLLNGSLRFGAEESAGAAFLCRDGSAWTTDKDGITAALLAAEITARRGRNPEELYGDLTHAFGAPVGNRIKAPATSALKALLAALSPAQVNATHLAGEPIERVINRAPGNDAPLQGIKVQAASGWYAARPSGTEDIYEIYAESFLGNEHLGQILSEAQALVDSLVASANTKSASGEP